MSTLAGSFRKLEDANGRWKMQMILWMPIIDIFKCAHHQLERQKHTDFSHKTQPMNDS
jgi:hypothetical protein